MAQMLLVLRQLWIWEIIKVYTLVGQSHILTDKLGKRQQMIFTRGDFTTLTDFLDGEDI